MALFDRMGEREQGASALSPTRRFDAVRWRFFVETALIGVGVAVLSFLLIWATVTNRISLEAIVVIVVILILAMFAMVQATKAYGRTQVLYERTREAVAQTRKAAEIMMEFLRDFTLKNQETISHMAESQKGRVIEELGKHVDDITRLAEDVRLRRELVQLKEMIGRKIMEIPSGVSFPLPRLERFDAALAQAEEPERIPKCPACGAANVRVRTSDSQHGIRYTCIACGHEFNVGITVLLEKNTS
ncbi:MAG: hypothetical protein HYZ81_00350 [Nitrospinae bacterium]|nr:hypothetical protein [Nitrospinota bacterium]